MALGSDFQSHRPKDWFWHFLEMSGLNPIGLLDLDLDRTSQCHVNAPQTSLGPHSPSHHLQLPCTACSRHFSSFWNASRHFFVMKEFFFLPFFLSSTNIQLGTGGALASLSWRSSRLFLGEQRVRWTLQDLQKAHPVWSPGLSRDASSCWWCHGLMLWRNRLSCRPYASHEGSDIALRLGWSNPCRDLPLTHRETSNLVKASSIRTERPEST